MLLDYYYYQRAIEIEPIFPLYVKCKAPKRLTKKRKPRDVPVNKHLFFMRVLLNGYIDVTLYFFTKKE